MLLEILHLPSKAQTLIEQEHTNNFYKELQIKVSSFNTYL